MTEYLPFIIQTILDNWSTIAFLYRVSTYILGKLSEARGRRKRRPWNLSIYFRVRLA